MYLWHMFDDICIGWKNHGKITFHPILVRAVLICFSILFWTRTQARERASAWARRRARERIAWEGGYHKKGPKTQGQDKSWKKKENKYFTEGTAHSIRLWSASECVLECVLVCIHERCTHVHVRVCIRMCSYAAGPHLSVFICVCVSIYMHILCIYWNIYVYVYMDIHIYIYMHIHIYIYTYTYIHI